MYNKAIKSPLLMIQIIATYLYFRHGFSDANIWEIITSVDRIFINKKYEVELFYINSVCAIKCLRTILAT